MEFLLACDPSTPFASEIPTATVTITENDSNFHATSEKKSKSSFSEDFKGDLESDIKGDFKNEWKNIPQTSIDRDSDPFSLAQTAESSFVHKSLTHREGYLWGYIDLVFRQDGRYYLLDWKSNRLSGYGKSELSEAMIASRYDWQLRLYSLALHRHLAATLPNYDYDHHFGGALYCFLRGAGNSETGGIYFERPSKKEFLESWIPWTENLLNPAIGEKGP
jgi:ATP-dependent exoDNAse (exonuclease V) beta subunit